MAENDDVPTSLVDVAAIQEEFKGPKAMPRQASLVVLTGVNMGEHHSLERASYVLGRHEQVDITLGEDGISRRHARVFREGELFFVEDMGSANGTFVNGVRLDAKQRLENGDKIGIGGRTILRFNLQDELDAEYQRRMHDAAMRDGATGALNKANFLQRLEAEFAYAARHRAELALLMLDIDHFKAINDTRGHPAGDAVLVELARLIAQTLRKEDVFGRYGGEEFGVLSRGIGIEGAARLAERLRSLVEGHEFMFQGRLVPVTVSVGVACYPSLDVDAGAKLLEAADVALYEAKRGGRNRFAVAPQRSLSG